MNPWKNDGLGRSPHKHWLTEQSKEDLSFLKQAKFQITYQSSVSPIVAKYLRNFYFRYDDYEQCKKTQVHIYIHNHTLCISCTKRAKSVVINADACFCQIFVNK